MLGGEEVRFKKKNLSELNYFLLSHDYHAFNYDHHTTLY